MRCLLKNLTRSSLYIFEFYEIKYAISSSQGLSYFNPYIVNGIRFPNVLSKSRLLIFSKPWAATLSLSQASGAYLKNRKMQKYFLTLWRYLDIYFRTETLVSILLGWHMFTGTKWNQAEKTPEFRGFFMFSGPKKARHGVTFLNETTAIWRDSNPRKHIK